MALAFSETFWRFQKGHLSLPIDKNRKQRWKTPAKPTGFANWEWEVGITPDSAVVLWLQSSFFICKTSAASRARAYFVHLRPCFLHCESPSRHCVSPRITDGDSPKVLEIDLNVVRSLCADGIPDEAKTLVTEDHTIQNTNLLEPTFFQHVLSSPTFLGSTSARRQLCGLRFGSSFWVSCGQAMFGMKEALTVWSTESYRMLKLQMECWMIDCWVEALRCLSLGFSCC